VLHFNYHNVKIGKGRNTDQVVIKGEITNSSGRDFNAVASRVVLFAKNTAISNSVFVINGMPNGMTRPFEKIIDELEYSQIGKDITHFEIQAESGF